MEVHDDLRRQGRHVLRRVALAQRPGRQVPRRPEMIQDRRTWTLAQLASDGFYFAAMLAALVGVVRRRAMWRTRHEWMILPILCAYFSAVHMVFESQGKYRYMLTPLMLLAAAAIGRKKPAAKEAGSMADR